MQNGVNGVLVDARACVGALNLPNPFHIGSRKGYPPTKTLPRPSLRSYRQCCYF